jgi:uncharacterized protein YndB with AHSA1/START domain
MATKTTVAPPHLDVSIEISATPRVVMDAFFDAASLTHWCGTVRSVTLPRVLGPYALEWATATEHDEVLGRLGGTFRGTVMHFEPTRGFFVADAFWLPPDSGPIGPMALEVTCTLCLTSDGQPVTRLRLTQNGFEESIRWRRYYDIVGAGWHHALESLKTQLENTQ